MKCKRGRIGFRIGLLLFVGFFGVCLSSPVFCSPSQPSDQVAKQFGASQWAEIETQYRDLMSRLDGLTALVSEQQTKIKTLETQLTQAEKLRKSLESSLNSAKQAQTELTQTIESLRIESSLQKTLAGNLENYLASKKTEALTAEIVAGASVLLNVWQALRIKQ